MKDCEFFNRIKKLVDSLSDKRLAGMLTKTNAAIEAMEKTKYYKDIESNIRDGALQFDMLREFQGVLDPNDVSLVIWLAGFRVAVQSNDSQYMLFQTAVYVASQRLSIHRIKDDKVRLVMTYIHLDALNNLL